MDINCTPVFYAPDTKDRICFKGICERHYILMFIKLFDSISFGINKGILSKGP